LFGGRLLGGDGWKVEFRRPLGPAHLIEHERLVDLLEEYRVNDEYSFY
jgi:hypothetical protein